MSSLFGRVEIETEPFSGRIFEPSLKLVWFQGSER